MIFHGNKDLDSIIWAYFYDPEKEIIFDNWIEIPQEQDKIKVFIFHQEQLFTLSIHQSNPKRMELKKMVMNTKTNLMTCSIIPDHFTHLS